MLVKFSAALKTKFEFPYLWKFIKRWFGWICLRKSHFGKFQDFSVAIDLIDQFKENFPNRSIATNFSYLWNLKFWSNFHSNSFLFHLLLFSSSKYIKGLICVLDVFHGKYLVHYLEKKKGKVVSKAWWVNSKIFSEHFHRFCEVISWILLTHCMLIDLECETNFGK